MLNQKCFAFVQTELPKTEVVFLSSDRANNRSDHRQNNETAQYKYNPARNVVIFVFRRVVEAYKKTRDW